MSEKKHPPSLLFHFKQPKCKCDLSHWTALISKLAPMLDVDQLRYQALLATQVKQFVLLPDTTAGSSSPSAIDSRAGQIFSPADAANQPPCRGPLLSPTAWSPDQHHATMLADVSRHMVDRTDGRGPGFGRLVRTHPGKCLKRQSSSNGRSDHGALYAGGKKGSVGPAPVSVLGQGTAVSSHKPLNFLDVVLYRCVKM